MQSDDELYAEYRETCFDDARTPLSREEWDEARWEAYYLHERGVAAND